MKIDNEKAMLKLRAVSIKHQNDKLYIIKGDRWFITQGSLPLRHNQSRFLWFWRFKVRVVNRYVKRENGMEKIGGNG
ncbi:MAG: hypothetical protein B6247_20815 [Candidatus Parabeggiatoa sp. nov. 2]|nr:MAG: hypothetical protein B6247_20815 [Beggiatoa sp. 4572_84]